MWHLREKIGPNVERSDAHPRGYYQGKITPCKFDANYLIVLGLKWVMKSGSLTNLMKAGRTRIKADSKYVKGFLAGAASMG